MDNKTGSNEAVIHGENPPIDVAEDSSVLMLKEIFCKTHYSGEQADHENRADLRAIFAPLVIWARKVFQEMVSELDEGAGFTEYSQRIINLWTPLLWERIGMLSGKVLVTELHISRLEGKLQGDTPSERYISFIQLFRDPQKVVGLLEEYPILAQQLLVETKLQINSGVELVNHLYKDMEELGTTFGIDTCLDSIKGLERVGDFHQQGRAVIIIIFASGKRIVYKPRSLAVDTAFQNLLRYLNSLGVRHQFKTVQVLDRSNYGWVEYVFHKACESTAEIRRFYWRQGANLALLYALQAVDFHAENLIADGEYPMLIDLEALLHPRLGPTTDKFHSQVVDKVIRSVMSIGMLPKKIWGKQPGEGLDLSGLGGERGQPLPIRQQIWVNSYTDEMRLESSPGFFRGSNNRPIKGVNISAYLEDFIDGFCELYSLIECNRGALLKEGGVISGFANVHLRYIGRPTSQYSRILSDSLHPDFMRKTSERNRLFGLLLSTRSSPPHLHPILEYERADLWNGDIPLFTHSLSSTSLYTSDGESIENFFDRRGKDDIERHLYGMSRSDCDYQSQVIKASFVTASPGTYAGPDRYALGSSTNVYSDAQFLEICTSIGDQICESAIKGDEFVNWMVASMPAEGQWHFTPADSSLYTGVCGIALFLGYLGLAMGPHGDKYIGFASMATNYVKSAFLESGRHSLKTTQFQSIGLFEASPTSVLHFFTHMSVVLNDPDLLTNFGPNLIKQIVQQANRSLNDPFDVIAGEAGAIKALLNYSETTGSPLGLSAATRLAHLMVGRLEEHSSSDNEFWSGVPSRLRLTGFSHGAAGYAWALQHLWKFSKNNEFLHKARAAINFERAHFCNIAQNWPDFRAINVKPGHRETETFMTTWCHGAPGIGLARLDTHDFIQDSLAVEEINTAVETTLLNGKGLNHSLCHGDLGNLELIYTAASWTGCRRLRNEFDRWRSNIMDSFSTYGFLNGIPGGIQSPALMNGLSGIGYQLLHFLFPETVPSILMLSPPPTKRGNRKPGEGPFASDITSRL